VELQGWGPAEDCDAAAVRPDAVACVAVDASPHMHVFFFDACLVDGEALVGFGQSLDLLVKIWGVVEMTEGWGEGRGGL